MDEELHSQQVHDAEPEDHPPEDGVGPDEGAVGEGQGGDDEEEGGRAAEAAEQVGPVVGVIPRQEIDQNGAKNYFKANKPGEGGEDEAADGQEQDGDGVRLVEVVQGDLLGPLTVGVGRAGAPGGLLGGHGEGEESVQVLGGVSVPCRGHAHANNCIAPFISF